MTCRTPTSACSSPTPCSEKSVSLQACERCHASNLRGALVGSTPSENPLARSLAVVSCMVNACERVRRYLFFSFLPASCELPGELVSCGDWLRRALHRNFWTHHETCREGTCMKVEGVYKKDLRLHECVTAPSGVSRVCAWRLGKGVTCERKNKKLDPCSTLVSR
jgi:hypothetical protein